MDFFNELAESLTRALAVFAEQQNGFPHYSDAVKWVLPPLAIFIFIRLLLSFIKKADSPVSVASLNMPNGAKLNVTRWENSIGRGSGSDIVVDVPSVSRNHAVLSKRKDIWTITDLGSKSGVEVNGDKVEQSCEVAYGDTISLAGAKMTLLDPIDGVDELSDTQRIPGDMLTLAFITLFQLVAFSAALFSGAEPNVTVVFVALGLIAVEWFYLLYNRLIGRVGLALELAGFWLSGVGLCICATAAPNSLIKQSVTCLIGIFIFCVLTWFLSDLDRAKKIRYPMGVAALLLFAVNIFLGQSRFGSRNWIAVGGMTIQPSEFIKIAFVCAEAAPLDRLMTNKNLTLSILFAGACIGSLFYMGDFGTALIFFVTFLILAFMRSGDIRTIALICSAAAIGAFAIIGLKPYIADRFAAWRHVWEFADSRGFQQTRTMMYSASGGLTGTGIGEGYLVPKNVAASDTDLVFGMLCEQWGLIIAVLLALTIVLFTFAAVRYGRSARSSFYIITSVAAAALMVFQLSLNVFGALDILPLTGVTFPFVSNGGSSIVASWGLLALIKAAQNDSAGGET